jgi:hypothetical protein
MNFLGGESANRMDETIQDAVEVARGRADKIQSGEVRRFCKYVISKFEHMIRMLKQMLWPIESLF